MHYTLLLWEPQGAFRMNLSGAILLMTTTVDGRSDLLKYIKGMTLYDKDRAVGAETTP